MQQLDIKAFAKINLSLDVLFKRHDGYHELEMIMQNIALHDIVSLELLSEPAVKLQTNSPKLPPGKSNLAYKAAVLMMEHFKLDAGVAIKLTKKIPVAAGLAGGSADAAAVMVGMNELFELKKSKKELMKLAKQIGADVPFCILNRTALARGIGEKLTPLKHLKGFGVLLVKPNYCVSTGEVYSRLDVKNIKDRPDTRSMLEHIENKDIRKIASGLCNVLENVTFKLYPELYELKRHLVQKGALGSLMSGSGPTVFGLFESISDAKRASESIVKDNHRIIVTEMV